jgi:hypothetical protein
MKGGSRWAPGQMGLMGSMRLIGLISRIGPIGPVHRQTQSEPNPRSPIRPFAHTPIHRLTAPGPDR